MIILHLHLDSAPQCMAYILDKWPLSVLLVRIWMRPIGSIEPAAWAKVVSQAALRPSYYVYFEIVQKQQKLQWDEIYKFNIYDDLSQWFTILIESNGINSSIITFFQNILIV